MSVKAAVDLWHGCLTFAALGVIMEERSSRLHEHWCSSSASSTLFLLESVSMCLIIYIKKTLVHGEKIDLNLMFWRFGIKWGTFDVNFTFYGL